MFLMFKFHGMPFFESGGTEVFKAASNKLFACSEKLIDNHPRHKAPPRWKTKVFLDNNFGTPFSPSFSPLTLRVFDVPTRASF